MTRLTAILPLLLALAVPAYADGIHKWVDSKGRVHFGDEASSEGDSTPVTPTSGNFVKTEHPVTGSLPAPAKEAVTPAPTPNPAANPPATQATSPDKPVVPGK